jgi:hypothetical protein
VFRWRATRSKDAPPNRPRVGAQVGPRRHIPSCAPGRTRPPNYRSRCIIRPGCGQVARRRRRR